MAAETVSKTLTSGTIFWPLFPFDVVKSELGHRHRSWNEGEEIVCPNKSDERTCVIQNTECFYEKHSGTCPYEAYHRHFLLEQRDRITKTTPIKDDDSLKGIGDAEDFLALRDTIGKSREAVSVVMNHFPQHQKCDKLFAGKLCGTWPSGGTPGVNRLKDMQIWEHPKVDALASSFDDLQIREKFYVGCEFLGQRESDGMPAEIAFHHLIDISRIKSLLPADNIDTNKDFIVPVLLSFFGDGKLDALLGLLVRCNDVNEKDDVKNFIAQALGSIAGIVKSQRLEFLNQWCRDLRSMVGGKFDAEISKNLAVNDQTVKIAVIKNGVEAIRSMALVLWADNKIALEDILDNRRIILKSKYFEFSCNGKVEFKSCRPEDCWADNFDKHKDRCEFICEFCKQAKTSIEEAFSTGKLKGALSRNTSEELMQIAIDDPIRARVLLQGGAGGGKGVAATDFHAHCMIQIAQPLSKVEIESGGISLAETEIVLIINNSSATLAFLNKWWAAAKTAKIEYLVQIEKVLRSLRDLPSYVERPDSKDVYDCFRIQLIGTGWWTWGNGKNDSTAHYDKLNTLIKHFRGKKGYPTTEDATEDEKWDWCIQTFLLLLGLKLVVELKREAKADWSFNLFQVNCGIMGGENSELAESILRLFGRSEKEKETPGIFQTCSYVGGTMFLDEIADAPVRIQDNLLRPLEEGKVSRPGWETIDEKVKNIRIVGATFKDLFKLSAQYQETLPTGKPRGFRHDLLTRLTRNPPVTIVPIWHHFVPDGKYSEKALRNQFCYVMSEATTEVKLKNKFWDSVYQLVKEKLDDHCKIAAKHLPDELDRRRHFASKITMRFFMAFKDRNFKDENKEREELTGGHKKYLDHMLDYLLCDS